MIHTESVFDERTKWPEGRTEGREVGREGGREEDKVQPGWLAAEGEPEGLASSPAAPVQTSHSGSCVASLEAVGVQAPTVGRQHRVPAGQESPAPQEGLSGTLRRVSQDFSALTGSLAGQGHGAGVSHKIQTWGHSVRLGQQFWKHTETRRRGQRPLPQSPAQAGGPRGLSGDVCVCVVGGVCVRVCTSPTIALYGW